MRESRRARRSGGSTISFRIGTTSRCDRGRIAVVVERRIRREPSPRFCRPINSWRSTPSSPQPLAAGGAMFSGTIATIARDRAGRRVRDGAARSGAESTPASSLSHHDTSGERMSDALERATMRKVSAASAPDSVRPLHRGVSRSHERQHRRAPDEAGRRPELGGVRIRRGRVLHRLRPVRGAEQSVPRSRRCAPMDCADRDHVGNHRRAR